MFVLNNVNTFVVSFVGLKLEAELGDDAEQEDQLCVFISEIEKGGMAYHQGKWIQIY